LMPRPQRRLPLLSRSRRVLPAGTVSTLGADGLLD
jgi:hypothetical protein